MALTAGTLFSQIIIFISSPLITRLYSPDVFGVLGVFMSLVTLISPVIGLMYPMAIVLPENDKEAVSVFWVSIIATIIITILSYLLIYILYVFQIRIKFISIDLLYWVCFVFGMNGIAQCFQYWLIRNQKFYLNAIAEASQSLVFIIIVLSIGYFYPNQWVLIFAAVLRSLIFFLFLMYGSFKYTNILSFDCSLSHMIKVAKEYISFPVYRMPQKLVNSIGLNIPVIFIGTYFNSSNVGYYSLSKNVVSVPVRLIGKSIADVFYPKLNNSKLKSCDIYNMLMKTTIVLSIAIILPFALFFLLSPEIFSFLYGQAWREAGEYAKWIAIWLFFGLINQPVVVAVSVLSLDREYFVYEVFSLILRSLFIFIGMYYYGSALACIILYSLISAICNMVLIIYVLIVARNNRDISFSK